MEDNGAANERYGTMVYEIELLGVLNEGETTPVVDDTNKDVILEYLSELCRSQFNGEYSVLTVMTHHDAFL